MQVNRILETSLYVDDLEAATAFYRTVLGAELDNEQPGRHAFFRVGSHMLLLFIAESSREEGEIPVHGADGPGHLAFAASYNELKEWEKRLASHGIGIEQRVDWPNGAKSLYFRDPSGNSLEFATPNLWFTESE